MKNMLCIIGIKYVNLNNFKKLCDKSTYTKFSLHTHHAHQYRGTLKDNLSK